MEPRPGSVTVALAPAQLCWRRRRRELGSEEEGKHSQSLKEGGQETRPRGPPPAEPPLKEPAAETQGLSGRASKCS